MKLVQNKRVPDTTRSGLRRLRAAAFMRAPLPAGYGDREEQLEILSFAVAGLPDPPVEDREQQVVIKALAMAVICHNLTAMDVFRAGTSREAVSLFEKRFQKTGEAERLKELGQLLARSTRNGLRLVKRKLGSEGAL